MGVTDVRPAKADEMSASRSWVRDAGWAARAKGGGLEFPNAPAESSIVSRNKDSATWGFGATTSGGFCTETTRSLLLGAGRAGGIVATTADGIRDGSVGAGTDLGCGVGNARTVAGDTPACIIPDSNNASISPPRVNESVSPSLEASVLVNTLSSLLWESALRSKDGSGESSESVDGT
jgi:hypothetical protein